MVAWSSKQKQTIGWMDFTNLIRTHQSELYSRGKCKHLPASDPCKQGHDDRPCACASSPLAGNRQKKRKGKSNHIVRCGGDLVSWNWVEMQRKMNLRYVNSQNTKTEYSLSCKKPIFQTRLGTWALPVVLSFWLVSLCLWRSNWHHLYASYASTGEVNRFLLFI